MCFAQVLMIPQRKPVFIREISNRMYGRGAYYWATLSACFTFYWQYSLLSASASYYFYDFHVHDA